MFKAYLPLSMKRMRNNDMSVYGWETEYDAWLKKQIDSRNFSDIINYENSHKLGKLAATILFLLITVLVYQTIKMK
jgi:aromatic ring-opening dioxygenase catalytic subunit (LigB family)